MIAYILEFVALVIVVIFLLFYFSEQQTPRYVQVLVATSWILNFVIILILPADISQTLEHEEGGVVKYLWMVVYYVNFVLTWVVLPVAQEYQCAGQFTFKSRLRRSLINNALFMLVFLLFAVALLLYLILSHQFEFGKLPSVLATIANTFGLCLVVVFLGHGLISLPKECFRNSFPKRVQNHAYGKAQTIKSRKQDIEFDLEIEIRKLNHLKNNNSYPYQVFCDKILGLIPERVRESVSQNAKAFEMEDHARPTQDKLVESHRKVKRLVSSLRMNDSWMDQVVLEVEKVRISQARNGYRYFKIAYLIGMVLSTLFSVIVFIGELSAFVPNTEKLNVLIYMNRIPNVEVVYILNTLLLLYIVFIISHSVFQMKIFGLYALHKKHSTSQSLLFTSINLSRVSYPLCYNYLQITGMPRIAFLSFFGQNTVGQQMSFIFPILLMVFGLFNLLDIYDRIMTYFGFSNYSFTDGEDELKSETEGKRIVEEILKNKRGMPTKKIIHTDSYLEMGTLL